jgi:hypothetical protein
MLYTKRHVESFTEVPSRMLEKTEKVEKTTEEKKVETVEPKKEAKKNEVVEKIEYQIYKNIVASVCFERSSKDLKLQVCRTAYNSCLEDKVPAVGACLKKTGVIFTKPPHVAPKKDDKIVISDPSKKEQQTGETIAKPTETEQINEAERAKEEEKLEQEDFDKTKEVE